jgi:hypothetical protein
MLINIINVLMLNGFMIIRLVIRCNLLGKK